MRIVGGTLGGRVLRAPAGADTRPTSEKVREAIFNILGSVEGANVLDLFAGSGGGGIEALSRGAARATFVDTAKAPLTANRANLRELGVSEARVTVVAGDAIAAAKVGGPWGLVFIDPPYNSDLAMRAVLAIPPANLVPGAAIVIEHDRRHVPPETVGSLLRTDQRRYGDTMVSFFRGPT